MSNPSTINTIDVAPGFDQAPGVSDWSPSADSEPEPKKASKQILKDEVREGLAALERPLSGLFVSGLSAGLDLGFSLFLMAVMLTQIGNTLPPLFVNLLVANMYSIGFIFVVLGRSELFTEQTTLAVLPVLSGRSSVWALLRLWSVVYVANIIGATVFAAMTCITRPAIGSIDAAALGTIAHRAVDHSSAGIFFSAVLAGWLMGLLSWLVAAGRDTIGQIVVVWLITAAIGFANLHHVVLGSVEVLAGAFAGQSITREDVAHFMLWATLGNTLGGTFFVAVIKYAHARPDAQSI